jgi:hypothetical protein
MLDRAERVTRLKIELTEHIRFLNFYEFLSDAWLRMADSLGQLAQVAFMENHFPSKERSPLLQEGKNDEGTLWDQERDQLSVRILLEEGKLNLCVRVLHDFKVRRRSPDFSDVFTKATVARKMTAANLLAKCELFEVSMGTLLKFALQHLESVQIIDLPDLLQHIAEVLTDTLAEDTSEDSKDAKANYSKKQEGTVVHYLHAIVRREENIDDDRVMELMAKNNIIALLAAHLRKCYTFHDYETLGLAAQTYHMMFCSDAYGVEASFYISTDEVKRDIVALKGLFVAELVSPCLYFIDDMFFCCVCIYILICLYAQIKKFGLTKSSVRKLLDHTLKWEMKLGKSKVVPLPAPPSNHAQ